MIGSMTKASVGRVVHVYSNRWSGPRPGMVVNGPWDEPRDFVSGAAVPCVNVNVFLDGHNDATVLAICRGREQGNTFASVPLLDAVTDGERDELWKNARLSESTGDLTMWAEWPPRV